MRGRMLKGLFVAVAIGSAVAGVVLAQSGTSDRVRSALGALTMKTQDEILSDLQIGFSQGRLSPDEACHLIDRLAAASGMADEKEGILLTIAHALEDDLPVSLLVEKAEEGLARRVSLSIILNGSASQPRILGLKQREYLLGAVRDLLFAKGIFSVSQGGQGGPASLPLSRFDHLVDAITDFLADYIEAGKSPLEGSAMMDELSHRLHTLSTLQKPVIPEEDVQLVLDRVGPGDLTNIALKLVEQP
jgi:hypothetical protein